MLSRQHLACLWSPRELQHTRVNWAAPEAPPDLDGPPAPHTLLRHPVQHKRAAAALQGMPCQRHLPRSLEKRRRSPLEGRARPRPSLQVPTARPEAGAARQRLSAPTRWRPRPIPLGPSQLSQACCATPGRLPSGPLRSQGLAVAGVSVLASSGPCRVPVHPGGQACCMDGAAGQTAVSLGGLLEVWGWGEAVGTGAARAVPPTPGRILPEAGEGHPLRLSPGFQAGRLGHRRAKCALSGGQPHAPPSATQQNEPELKSNFY